MLASKKIDIPEIKLYGANGCYKTHYYQQLLEARELPYTFLDVKANEVNAEELRSLYENRKLNFPTITIGKKKLRNPHKNELDKWINKMIPSILNIEHEKENHRFTMTVNGGKGVVDYRIRDDKMHLVHSEVPYNLRGRGIGKILVEKTFEKLTEEGYKAVAVCPFIKAVAQRSDRWRPIIKH